MFDVSPDPLGRANHWMVDGELVAGPKTAKAAVDLINEYNYNAKNPVKPPTTVGQVRMEAQRRMMSALSARDTVHLDLIITNGLRESVRLQNKLLNGGDLTKDEKQRAAMLEGADAIIEAIRAASNVLEVSPPTDYQNDEHWP